MFKKVLLGILFVLALCAIGIVLFAKDFEVNISEETAQDAINAQVKAGAVKKLGVKIELKTAEVDFRPDNTMKISAEFGTETLGYSHKVGGVFQSGISYQSPKIYLHNISPVTVDVQTDDETKEELGEIKSAARKFLQRQKDRVKSENNKAVLEAVIGKDLEAFQDNIVTATYGFFEFIPIYNLKNAGYKGSLASLALKDVHFTDDYAIVTLSPVKALLRILSIIGTIFLILAYVIVRVVMSNLFLGILNRDKSSDN